MSVMEESPTLLNLPDDVICELLRYLDATSLYFLARTCTRLDALIKGHITLWKRIDARRAPYSRDKLKYCLKRIYNDGNTWTETFLIRGDANDTPPKTLYPRLRRFSKLTVLAVENMKINGEKYDVMVFPPQLHELSLRRTEVTKSTEFFRGSSEHFPNLRVLVLDECNWLYSSALIPISKYRSLEILSVYKCRSLTNSVAYLSLSSHGFKTLKILDARLSYLGNDLIKAIYKIESLMALYFQNEDVSYQLDYFRRKLELLKGAPAKHFATKENEFHVDEENWQDYEDSCTVDDMGLLDYVLVWSKQQQEKLPRSRLYTDPYRTCSCGYDDNRKKYNNGGDDSNGGGDDDNRQIRRLSEKIDRLNDYIRRCRTNTRFRRGLPDNTRTASPTVPPIYRDTAGMYVAPSNEEFFIHFLSGDRLRQVRQDLNGNGPSANARRHPNGPDSSSDESDEPPRKLPRTDEPTAGPSGLSAAVGSDSSSDGDDVVPAPPEPEVPPLRPPTPHPLNEFPTERNTLRIYFRDAGVQIESIDESRKTVKVPLRRLSLRGYHKITDAGLKYLRDVDLDLLDVTYTNVTVEGIEGYLRSHPLCRVVHENYCTCPVNLHF